jgi:hypothetical protein
VGGQTEVLMSLGASVAANWIYREANSETKIFSLKISIVIEISQGRASNRRPAKNWNERNFIKSRLPPRRGTNTIIGSKCEECKFPNYPERSRSCHR